MVVPYYKVLESTSRKIPISREAENNNGYVEITLKDNLTNQEIKEKVEDYMEAERVGSSFIVPNGMLYEYFGNSNNTTIHTSIGDGIFDYVERVEREKKQVEHDKQTLRRCLAGSPSDLSVYNKLPQQPDKIKSFLFANFLSSYSLNPYIVEELLVPDSIIKQCHSQSLNSDIPKINYFAFTEHFRYRETKRLPITHYYNENNKLVIKYEENYFSKEVERALLTFDDACDYIEIYRKFIINNSVNLKELFYNYFKQDSNEQNRNYYSKNLDILVCMVGFDKIETMQKKTITTSHLNINERFYNYLLMEYQIKQLPKLVLNKEKNTFEFTKINPFSLEEVNDKELELAEEIKTIKKRFQLMKDIGSLDEYVCFYLCKFAL